MTTITLHEIENEMLTIVDQEIANHSIDDHSPTLADTLRSYITRPGRRLRPQLLIETARACGYTNEPALLRVAAATELLHIFALLHDDRLDGASRVAPPETRNDQAPAAPPQHYELLAGDILHTTAHSVLVDAVHNFDIAREILATVRRVSITTIAGQAMDIEFLHEASPPPTCERLKTLYDRKTGFYSFVAPLTIALLLAGAPSSQQSKAQQAGLALGRAFQFRDDLVDIRPFLEGDGAHRPHAAYWEFNLAGTYMYEARGIDTRSQWSTGAARSRLLSTISFRELAQFTEEQVEQELEESRAAVAALNPDSFCHLDFLVGIINA
ncbi:MAG: polyprenyl synthetase family protein [Spirochaeta sp.]|nr:polyprenyl synthetase family protein [Spirochaeta sp.]